MGTGTFRIGAAGLLCGCAPALLRQGEREGWIRTVARDGVGRRYTGEDIESIKTALAQFVFAPNDGKTWVTVVSMVSNFLQWLWAQGGLMGDKASDAFTVQCGLGSTMTGQDILDGYMIVSVTLQMIRPAEFIELTFKQQMQGAA